jgi:hypothetical protein
MAAVERRVSGFMIFFLSVVRLKKRGFHPPVA